VFLQDVPGLMVGSDAERAGILKAYERVALRLATATVPKIAIILRKAYGGGHFALGGRPTRPDFLFAWPSAEMGFMAPETGVRTVHRRSLDQILETEGVEAREAAVAALHAEWVTESEPWEAAAVIALDDIIEPSDTREILVRALAFATIDRGPGANV
jgi:acetyl-CoA carboxylase carboxyltransferase component